MKLSLSGRVALVTGGARGIGAGIVRALAGEGMRVMVADIGVSETGGGTGARDAGRDWSYLMASDTDLEATLASGSDLAAVHVDVTDPASCAAAVAATVEEFGQLDILVNNAGVVDSGPIEDFNPEVWDRIFAVNAKGIFLMSQAALPYLRASDQACIVNTASIAGKKGYGNMSAYCGSKFAAIGITQSLATELAPEHIRVNVICPGMVGTAMWLEHLLPANTTDEAEKVEVFEARMAETIPLGRHQTTDDMGEAVVYLATAGNVTGVSLSVDGGFDMR